MSNQPSLFDNPEPQKHNTCSVADKDVHTMQHSPCAELNVPKFKRIWFDNVTKRVYAQPEGGIYGIIGSGIMQREKVGKTYIYHLDITLNNHDKVLIQRYR